MSFLATLRARARKTSRRSVPSAADQMNRSVKEKFAMSFKGTFQSGTKRRRIAVSGAAMAAFLSLPVMMYSFDPNPPIGYTGAPGQGQGCASCHGTLTTPSALTITAPASYTPGGAAVPMSVSMPARGGFELVILAGSAQAGTLMAGTGSQVKPLGTIQDLSDSASNTSWSFMWTPPATNVGSVTVYATGGTHNTSYLSTATITAGTGGGPPPSPTLNLSPTSLTFSAAAGGTAPSQNVQVTTSNGSAATFSAAAAVTTPSGGTWLSIGSTTGTTPATESVSVNTTGLAAGTYNGSVMFTSSALSNSPVTLPVTLTVGSSTPPPTGQTYSVVVVDRQSGGSDWLLLSGSGSVSSSNTVTGSGYFTRFRSVLAETSDGSPGAPTSFVIDDGTWKPTGVTSSASGKMVLQVQLTSTTSSSSSLSTGTLTITNTAPYGDATLAIDQGATFNPAGVGRVKLTAGGGGGGGGDDDGGGGTTTGGDSTTRGVSTLPDRLRPL